MQMKLDEEAPDTGSSDSDDDDDDMPQLSPISPITSHSIDPPSIIHDSTSVTSTSTVQRPCSRGEKSVRTKSSADDLSDTRLYCICRTAYDETKYVTLSSRHMTLPYLCLVKQFIV